MSGHSPGPWTVVDKWEDEDAAISGADGLVVGYAWNGGKESERDGANARLLAAAPVLLAMLKRMATPEVSRCEVNRSMVDVDRECGEMNRCEPFRAALEAEALIARLEGGR